jgi:membrane protease YdiL (CAAX protease family)
VLVLIWAKLSRTPWREIGYQKPKNWITTIAVGIIFGVAFKFIMKALVMPLFGADPINRSYHFLAGNRELLPAAIWTMLMAGFGEETVFRGFMFERLGKLLGDGCMAKISIVLFTSAWFALSHYANQGWTGVEQAAITGLVFGSIFATTRRIWMIMIAHAVFDLTALGIIYWNLETAIAHLVFK